MIDNKIKTTISPLKEEIKELKSNLKEICASQSFISDKPNEVANEYNTVLVNNKKQKEQIIKLNERADDLQKKIKNEKLKLDELDQYNRRQKLEFIEVPLCNNKDVNQIVMDLIKR